MMPNNRKNQATKKNSKVPLPAETQPSSPSPAEQPTEPDFLAQLIGLLEKDLGANSFLLEQARREEDAMRCVILQEVLTFAAMCRANHINFNEERFDEQGVGGLVISSLVTTNNWPKEKTGEQMQRVLHKMYDECYPEDKLDKTPIWDVVDHRIEFYVGVLGMGKAQATELCDSAMLDAFFETLEEFIGKEGRVFPDGPEEDKS